ncbi:SGNH/GDSL hydrolase family protein [Bacteroides reticulotermitis]|nr:SGNH/GDSL hydrolase family protein [Bacteroides reticulotermitis]MBB4043326.1 lysophospholipase L1-like esterase [Bacteroides reticulotermitis]
MKKKNLNQYLLLILICSVCFAGETYAQKKDFGNLERYAKDNAALPPVTKKEKRVVFLGNSITEGWVRTHPDFFKANGYIGRGIGGQTSYQFLLRFREDVIKLSPSLVVINAGTNDVAENTGPYNEDYTFGNIVSMVELAKANHIKVILTSVLPAASFKWNQAITDAPQKIEALNARIEAYAKSNKIPFVNYYGPMVVSADKSLNSAYTQDGVHPTPAGYDVMERLIKAVVEKER